MKWVLPAAVALLAGCEQPAAVPPPGGGPASLLLAPIDYYSRAPSPGPSGGATRAKPARGASEPPEEDEAPALPPVSPEEMPDLLKRIETLDGRMQELQKKLLRPPWAKQPPPSIEPPT